MAAQQEACVERATVIDVVPGTGHVPLLGENRKPEPARCLPPTLQRDGRATPGVNRAVASLHFCRTVSIVSSMEVIGTCEAACT
jgi:hypothetical protein